MAGQRTPSPLGLQPASLILDRGTLQLAAISAPGPIRTATVVGASANKSAPAATGPEIAEHAATPVRSPEERVLAALPHRSRNFVFEGSTLRLARTAELRSLQRQTDYQVIRTDEAKAILETLTATPSASHSEKAALQEAASMLPTRGIVSESKLLLLRVVPRRAAGPLSSEPAMTPSQIARRVREEQHWIEIQLVDEDQDGLPGVEYVIVTPDNQKHSGVTGADGVARLDNIPPGQCKISFPQLDKEAWGAA